MTEDYVSRPDYRISHQAPGFEDDGTTVRLCDVGQPVDTVFPSDVTTQSDRYGAAYDETERNLKASFGNPDADITIYRAVPEGVTQIHPGDWVGISYKYAQREAAAEGDTVISASAKASDLWSKGLLEEWGYQGPEDLQATQSPDLTVVRAAFPTTAQEAVTTRAQMPNTPEPDYRPHAPTPEHGQER